MHYESDTGHRYGVHDYNGMFCRSFPVHAVPNKNSGICV